MLLILNARAMVWDGEGDDMGDGDGKTSLT